MMYPQPITPNNKLPDEYVFADIRAIMEQRKQYRVKCGNNTYAALVERQLLGGKNETVIEIVLYMTTVATLRSDGSVMLTPHDVFTVTTADRMSRAVAPLGYKVTCRTGGQFEYPVYYRGSDGPVAYLRHWLLLTPISIVGPEGYRQHVTA